MKRIKFSELINIDLLEKMVKNLYDITGLHISIIDVEGSTNIAIGWQDICTKFHRMNPATCRRCYISDRYINEHIYDGRYLVYKCLNNLWDIAIPIIVTGQHIATIYFGQFFYDDEVVDIENFRLQAEEFGFDEKEYLDALKKVPVFSKDKVEHIVEYYSALVMNLAESAYRELVYRESKKELEKSQKYLKTIFNCVSDAIIIHDIKGNIVDVNDTTISMFGYTKDELLKMNVNSIGLKYSDNTDFNIDKIIEKAKNKNPIIEEIVIRNKNNNKIWVEANINITSIYEDVKIVATVRDITERKKAELESKNAALEIEKIRAEFFANISHELRTPLNIILCTIQVIEMHIKNRSKTIDRNKIINNMNIEKQNCYRLLRLINNLIDSTKIDSGYVNTIMVNYDIVHLVKQITSSVAQYIKNNDLNLSFYSNIDKKVVACDPDKIERIMLNLLSNSIKFTEPGGDIFVNVLDGKEFITITVEDTGIGIPKEKLGIIFNKFTQVDKSFTRKKEGSGIGLSLVKALVEMQGGTISVESEYGTGTKFFIKIPAVSLKQEDKREKIKFINNNISNYSETIKVEFSDIYR